MKRSPAGRVIANARARVVVDFGGDPYAEAHQRSLAGEIASRLQGLGGHIYTGDRGDPTRSFGGAVVGTPQQFVTAAPVVGVRPSSAASVAGSPQIDTAPADVYADPAARIFAERARRR